MNMLQQKQEEKQDIEKQLEKQMGCMAGFFQLFDRHHIGKSLVSPKRILSSPPLEDSKPETETETKAKTRTNVSSVPDRVENPAKSPLLPVLELKDGTRSSWKFAPRLSLDSRAIVDNKGTLHPRDIRTTKNNVDDESDEQRRSPSVIARLMGLETLDNYDNHNHNSNLVNNNDNVPQLRRSASESRVNKDLYNYQFIDPSSFKLKQSQQHKEGNVVGDLKECNKVSRVLQRKSYFDSADFFPEPKQRQQCVSIYGEIEKRLKMRGIFDQPSSKDLESLKHILEALQLKGLLHSKNCNNQRNLNFVYENERDESPIVVMKPGKTGARRDNVRGRTSSPTRNESGNSPTIRQRRQLGTETQRRTNTERQRSFPAGGVRSPRTRTGQISSRSPRNKKPTAEICSSTKCDESSTLSDTISTCSQTDKESLSKAEEYREGRSLLERCDKLLNSIAEMTTTTTSLAELQPSPVSVLDSSFYNEESSPSPVLKRSLEFKELPAELDEDIWSPTLSEDSREHGDFAYISEVLRAWKCLPEDSDVFSLLEKQQRIKGRDISKVSILERKLIFDTLNEILNRKKQLPAWKANNLSSLEMIWSEYQKIRERDTSDQGDLFEVICGVLKKDLARDAINGWGDCPVEMSEAVLDIERLIFKDLIGETIRDLAAFSVNCNKVSVSRRKLVF